MALCLRGSAAWDAGVEGIRKDLMIKFFGSEEAYMDALGLSSESERYGRGWDMIFGKKETDE